MNHTSRGTMLAAALLFSISLAGCGKSGGPPGGNMVVNVVVFQSRVQPVEERISLVGTLQANEAVELKSELDGPMATVHFEEGQRVLANDILMEFDRAKLQAAMAAAVAELQLADTKFQRYQRLVDSGAVSRQEMDEASAIRAVRGAAVASAEENVRDATVRAPFDGIIGARLVSPGQYVTRGTPLAWVVDLDPMKAEFQVPERYLKELRPGQPAEVRVDAYPDERFTGEVTFVDPQIDETTRTVLVKAALPNPDDKLRRGMFANLHVILRVRERAVVIPETALLLQGDATSVYVIEQDKAQPRPVTTGTRLPGLVEITQGLTAGEAVVVEGTQKLFPGASVKTRFSDEVPPPKPFGPPSPMGSSTTR